MPARSLATGAVLAAVAVAAAPALPAADPQNQPGAAVGISPAQVQQWYTTSQGNEVYPYRFYLALNDVKTGQPFSQNPGRFGLLDNPQGTPGVPAGMTVEVTRDLQFLGLKMLGMTCAACHTGQLDLNGQPVMRLIGGPSQFDFTAFFGSLAENSVATAKSPTEAFAFLYRLYNQPSDPGGADGLIVGEPSEVFRKTLRFAYERRGDAAANAFEAEFAREVERLAVAERGRPAPLLQNRVVTSSPDAAVTAAAAAFQAGRKIDLDPTQAELLRGKAADLRADVLGRATESVAVPSALVREPLSEANPLSRVPAEARLGILRSGFGDAIAVLRLLYARYRYIERIVSAHTSGTPPLFGRLDAFGGARNALFSGPPTPTTAPVSFPHLWGMPQVSWFHWDGNDQSRIERDVGEAVATGAATDLTGVPLLHKKPTYVSTVRVANIEALESLVDQFTPPEWPSAFGVIDGPKAAKGKAIYTSLCLACHKDPSGPPPLDVLLPLTDIKTDPNRANNFAAPLTDGREFYKALSDVSKAIVNKNGGSSPPQLFWRATDQYVGRPLRSPWATAPYLHNGSVPTLYHLLLPPDQRPATFPVGHREYDPKRLGFVTDVPGTSKAIFDTSVTGNSNAGHAGAKYGTELSEDERWQLLEYLKTLR